MIDLLEDDSKAASRNERRFPGCRISNPNLISKTLTELVQREFRGCWSNHLTTLGSDSKRMRLEITFVARMIMVRTSPASLCVLEIQECPNRRHPSYT